MVKIVKCKIVTLKSVRRYQDRLGPDPDPTFQNVRIRIQLKKLYYVKITTLA